LSGNTILVNVEHLSSGSHIKIKIKCDYCDTHKEMMYKEYIKNIKKQNNIYSCSVKCRNLQMSNKICKNCNTEKEVSDFYKKLSVCKKCHSILNYQKNKDRDRIKNNERSKIWCNNNREKLELYRKNNKDKRKEYYIEYNKKRNYYQNNKEKVSERSRELYRENIQIHRKYHRNWAKNKRDNDPLFKLRMNLQSLIRSSIRNYGCNKNRRTEEILGCGIKEFIIFIENKFIDGMCWENYGEWHLDHIIPSSWAKTEEEVYNLNNFNNFQPLWAFENISKGARFSG